MRWLIGIDLRALSRGALAFAHWLGTNTKDNHFHGVHVVEGTRNRSVLEGKTEAQLERFHDHVAQVLREQLADPLFESLEVHTAPSADVGLGDLATESGAEALIVGRMKPAGKSSAIHLGRVARRLLRRLPVPTVVVPPDLAAVPEGPIVLATDLGPASADAVRFARGLAADVGRKLKVVHVRRAEDHLDIYLPREDYVRVVSRAEAHARTELQQWQAEVGLGDVEASIAEGHTTRALLDFVREVNGSVLVVGSRGLSTVQRLFTSSTASQLAAIASVPVAVVPGGGAG